MNPNRYLIKPGSQVDLKDRDPGDHHFWASKDEAAAATAALTERLSVLQERMYANGKRSLLVVLQGMDTSGKDGTIRQVLTGVNPQGCHVTSFKAPTHEEKAHDFLWRIHRRVPAAGMIGIFNRSHYEDVLITRVHAWISEEEAERRLKAIRHFEHHLADSGTLILKFFLHISKDEQKERLQKRVDDPDKRWKFNVGDLEQRKFWKQYRHAFEDAIGATSADHAPWYVVPSNEKWYRNWVIAKALVNAMEKLDLKRPKSDPSINFKTLRIR